MKKSIWKAKGYAIAISHYTRDCKSKSGLSPLLLCDNPFVFFVETIYFIISFKRAKETKPF